MPAEAEEERFDRFLFTGIVVLLIIVAGALIAFKAFTREPVYYSEVYFAGETIVDGARIGERIPVNFFIGNHEGKTLTYTYLVSAFGGDKVEKEIELQDGELKEIREFTEFETDYGSKQRVTVEVEKPDSVKPYALWFWVEVS